MLVRFDRGPVARPWFDDVFSFERDIDNMFRSFLGGNARPFAGGYPAVDVAEHADETVVIAELPGVRREDVKVSLHDGVLTIAGERKSLEIPENAVCVRNEISPGSFSRSFDLPHAVKADAIEAELANGVLRVRLPKAEEARPREISVK